MHARFSPGLATKDENTQPFRYHRWLFAHDGTIGGVRGRQAEARRRRSPTSSADSIAGDTDSEHAFMVFAKHLKDEGRLDDLDLDAADRRTRAREDRASARGVGARRRRAEAEPARASSRRTAG